MKKTYQHPLTGKIKQVKVGYSFTTMFFGFFPALFRGDFKWAVITFLVVLIAIVLIDPIIGEKLATTLNRVGWILWAGVYNEKYEKELIRKGYRELI